MKQIQIFSNYDEERLQREINSWIKDNDHKIIVTEFMQTQAHDVDVKEDRLTITVIYTKSSRHK